ncbi:MAG: class I SAM-dependent methyltransferase [Fusobacteriota bacterium]
MSNRCKICKSDNLDIINDKKDKNKYFWCQECDFIFIDKENIVDSNTELEVYKKHDNTIENEGYVKMFERFIANGINPYCKKSGEVLEFGSGPGPVLAELLKRRGYEVDIYDPYFSPEKVYKNKKYDIITSTEVFEHFKDPLKEMDLLTKLLKDDGYVVIMTRFHPQTEEKFKKWWYRRDLTHISFYTPKTLGKLAYKYDLDLVFYDDRDICVFKNNK